MIPVARCTNYTTFSPFWFAARFYCVYVYGLPHTTLLLLRCCPTRIYYVVTWTVALTFTVGYPTRLRLDGYVADGPGYAVTFCNVYVRNIWLI